VGEVPWHGLGAELDAPATGEVAIQAAGLDWAVSTHELFLADGTKVPMSRGVRRDDNGAILGTVGTKWRPIQNVEAFSFLDGVTNSEIRYETAGALGEGEKVWLLGRIEGEVRVGKDDVVRKHLLLSNNHNGEGALHGFFTPIRVVCANTLSAAFGRKEDVREGVSIRHSGDVAVKVQQASQVLGLAHKFYAKFGEAAQAMADRKLAGADALAYFQAVYPMPAGADELEEETVKVRNVKATWEELAGLYLEGAGADIPDVRHSLWTAWNAVTEFVDHAKATVGEKSQGNGAVRARRLASNWFGEGVLVKKRAFAEALAVLKG
jgi:phage/plasmid-like protein (TIGR03299 family)